MLGHACGHTSTHHLIARRRFSPAILYHAWMLSVDRGQVDECRLGAGSDERRLPQQQGYNPS
jgi:hypothetical protein